MKTDAKNPPMAPGKIRRSRTREVAAEVVQFEPPQVTAEIRERKLARFRWAIESGTYQVSAEKIADKMIGGGVLDDVLAPQVF